MFVLLVFSVASFFGFLTFPFTFWTSQLGSHFLFGTGFPFQLVVVLGMSQAVWMTPWMIGNESQDSS